MRGRGGRGRGGDFGESEMRSRDDFHLPQSRSYYSQANDDFGEGRGGRRYNNYPSGSGYSGRGGMNQDHAYDGGYGGGRGGRGGFRDGGGFQRNFGEQEALPYYTRESRGGRGDYGGSRGGFGGRGDFRGGRGGHSGQFGDFDGDSYRNFNEGR